MFDIIINCVFKHYPMYLITSNISKKSQCYYCDKTLIYGHSEFMIHMHCTVFIQMIFQHIINRIPLVSIQACQYTLEKRQVLQSKEILGSWYHRTVPTQKKFMINSISCICTTHLPVTKKEAARKNHPRTSLFWKILLKSIPHHF